MLPYHSPNFLKVINLELGLSTEAHLLITDFLMCSSRSLVRSRIGLFEWIVDDGPESDTLADSSEALCISLYL